MHACSGNEYSPSSIVGTKASECNKTFKKYLKESRCHGEIYG